MARLKPKNSITTRAQAEAAMSKLNQIDQMLAGMDLAEAAAIAAVRDEHAKLQRKTGRPGLEAEKALLVKELEGWSEQSVSTWDKKTIETPAGSFGFRVSTPAVNLIKKVAKSFDAALELVQKYMSAYVREKPEINKEKILEYYRSENEEGQELFELCLAKCGLKIDQDDEFWIETAASKDLEAAAKKLKAA